MSPVTVKIKLKMRTLKDNYELTTIETIKKAKERNNIDYNSKVHNDICVFGVLNIFLKKSQH